MRAEKNLGEKNRGEERRGEERRGSAASGVLILVSHPSTLPCAVLPCPALPLQLRDKMIDATSIPPIDECPLARCASSPITWSSDSIQITYGAYRIYQDTAARQSSAEQSRTL
jgi:hypothetical protein